MTRSGGYILSGEECYHLDRAVCTEDESGGVLSLAAEGERALFLLPDLVWQSRTGWIEDLIHLPWPYDVPWREPEITRLDRLGFVELPDLEVPPGCGLWVPGRLLEIVKVQVEFEEVDVPRSLVTATVRILGMSEAGDHCQEFDLWLCCAYTGDRLEQDG